MAEKTFEQAFKGNFKGVLRWEQLEELWQKVIASADDGWYLYAVGEQPPQQKQSGEKIPHFLQHLTELLKQEHGEDYCGVVYADDFQQPSIIKVYDPNHLGSSCGSSGLQIFPGWVISKSKPEDLNVMMPPPNNRRRWWKRIFS